MNCCDQTAWIKRRAKKVTERRACLFKAGMMVAGPCITDQTTAPDGWKRTDPKHLDTVQQSCARGNTCG